MTARRATRSLQLSIRGKIALAFISIAFVVAAIGWFAAWSMSHVGNLVVDTYDKPLQSISFARAIHADFASMEAVFARRASEKSPAARAALDAQIESWSKTLSDDLAVAAARATSDNVRNAVAKVAKAADAWQDARAAMTARGDDSPDWSIVDASAATVRDQIDLLVNYAAGDGFRQRKATLAAIEENRTVQMLGAILAAVLAALVMFNLAYRIVTPVAAASRAASRIAEGELDVPIEISGRDELANLLSAMSLMRDNIRATMEREIALRRTAQMQLADAIDSSGEGFVLIGPDRRILLSNAEIERLCGGPEFAPRAGDTLDEAAERIVGGGVFRIETAQQRAQMSVQLRMMEAMDMEAPLADGRWVRLSRSRTGDGGAIFIVSEITLAKEREAVLRDAAVRAEAANRAKSEFLATMGHELRTPLNAVIGFSEIMTSEAFGPLGNPQYLDFAGDILASGRHLLEIINDILALAQSDAGKLRLAAEECDLGELVQDCMPMTADMFARAGVTLAFERPATGVIAVVDEVKIRQALLNILSNAAKFSPEGGATRVSVAHQADGRPAITVADDGIGMRQEDIPTALAPFGQIDSRLARKYQGTGLGLTLTKAIVDLHDGSLEIASRPGAGTTVTIVLPGPAAAPGLADIALAS